MALLTVYHGGYQAVDKPKINNCFLYMPEQVFTLGRNNEIILTFVPHQWFLELYNDEPKLFN